MIPDWRLSAELVKDEGSVVKKQLKIWKADFNRYWDKTSLVMRIVIGASVSLLLTYLVMDKINRPLSQQVGEKRKAISDTAVVDGAIYILDELRTKRDNVNKKLKTWEKKLAESKDCESSLTPLESSKVIIAVRRLFDKNSLKLINEQKIKQQKNPGKKSSYRNRHKKIEINTKIKLKPPEYIDYISYQIKAYGRFKDIKNFLTDINEVKHVFVMNNIAFFEGQYPALDRKFNLRKGIEINFELHIPYLKDSVAKN